MGAQIAEAQPRQAGLAGAQQLAGPAQRQIFLGDTLDTENMRANCEHGVLTLTIPVAETAKPRRVQVGGSPDAQTIEPQAAGGA